MDTLILIFKGFFIGVGKIIPGVSGSLIAIILGVYDRLIEILSNIFKNLKENIKFLFPLGIGILLAIASTSRLLSYLLSNYYIVTMFFFIGLLVGGVPSITKKVKYNKKSDLVYTIISLVLVLSIYFLKSDTTNTVNNYPIYIMLLIGMLDAATMIIPGISGTAIMMLLGCYNTVLEMFSDMFMLSNLINIFPFFIGVVIGVILISRIISYCLNNYNRQTNCCILGFTSSSVILLVIQTLNNDISFSNIFIGLILMVLGFIISYTMEKK